jgi:phthiocerol/phenolphthiocerol synthesis type-I polyketide synthase C
MATAPKISIAGIGCRFPGGSDDCDSFWELLSNRSTAIKSIPGDRGWTADDYLDADSGVGKTVTTNAGWLDAVDAFDPAVFKISPKEADEMDPQQRLVMEASYEALLDAYINPASLAGTKTGVYVGAGIAEYMAMAFGDPNNMTSHTMSGNSLAVIANRVSFAWDLRGPSLTTDTACSSAMTAFHLACQAIEAGEIELAIVAGVNTLLGPSPFIGFTQAKMLSSTGASRPFDANANGFVRGEGCGVTILCRDDCLAKYTSCPPRVYAQVRGHGINEDGRTKSLTMPSGESQRDLIVQVIEGSNTNKADIVYVEAHGTGTPVGDPIESVSISEAVGAASAPGTACVPIGSAKGHVGHLETAAGIVGVIKSALCLYHGKLAPTAGFESWSPKIDHVGLRLRVVSETEDLPVPASGGRAVIGINSYGFGGANGFALLEEASDRGAKSGSDSDEFVDVVEEVIPGSVPPMVLSLGSHFKEGTGELWGEWSSRKSASASALARDTAVYNATRPPARFRKVAVAPAGTASLTDKAVSTSEGDCAAAAAVARKLTFAFGGQGSHYPSMGVELYAQFEGFRGAIDRMDAEWQRLSGKSLRASSGFTVAPGGIGEEHLNNIMVTLPAIALHQAATVVLLRAAGVRPAAVLGHSTGEMLSAFAAERLDELSFVQLVYARALAQSKMGTGAMAAWAASSQHAQAAVEELGLAEKVSIACMNTASAVTLAGEVDAVAALVAHGKATGTRCTVLAIPRAYHSNHVDGVAGTFNSAAGACVEDVSSRDGAGVAFFSSTEGRLLAEGEATNADFWFRNMRRPVRFRSAMSAVLAGGFGEDAQGVVLEVSPHQVLAPYLAEALPTSTRIGLAHKARPEGLTFVRALAQLHCAGVDVDFAAILPAPALPAATALRLARAPLPAPRWRHDGKFRFRSVTWRNPYSHGTDGSGREASTGGAAPGGGGGGKAASAFSGGMQAGANAATLATKAHPYLLDHVIDNEVILPAAGYCAIALQRQRATTDGSAPGTITDAKFLRLLPLWVGADLEADEEGAVADANHAVEVAADGPRLSLRCDGKEYMSCATPRNAADAPAALSGSADAKLGGVKALFGAADKGVTAINLQLAYKAMAQHSGLVFGETFRRITSLKTKGVDALAEIEPPAAAEGEVEGEFSVHPCVLDAAFQALAFVRGLDSDSFVPVGADAISVVAKAGYLPHRRNVVAHARLTSMSRDGATGDIDLYDSGSGELALVVRNLQLRRAPSATSAAPVIYAATPQRLRFAGAAGTAAMQPLAELQTLLAERVATGAVVRVLGRGAGAAEVLVGLAATAEAAVMAAPAESCVHGGAANQLCLVLLAASDSDAADAKERSTETAAETGVGSAVAGLIQVTNDTEAVAGACWDVVVQGDAESARTLLTPGGVFVNGQQWCVPAAPVDAAVAAVRRTVVFTGAEAGWESALRTAADGGASAQLDAAGLALSAAGTAATANNQVQLFLPSGDAVADTKNASAVFKATAAAAMAAEAAEQDFAATIVVLVRENEEDMGAAPSPLWGLTRAARNELGAGVTILALGVPLAAAAAAAKAVLEIVAATPAVADRELTLRADGEWYVPRLRRAFAYLAPPAGAAAAAAGAAADATDGWFDSAPASDVDVRLQVGRPGQLSSLKWHPLATAREGLRDDEVLVDVRAVSLHFKDVMLAMGMLPEFKPIIGMECAGIVREVGKGAQGGLAKGDRVMCLAMSTSTGEERSALFGSSARVQLRQAVKAPKGVTAAAASGFLGVMATAYYALTKAARIQQGDWVLIHSAMGGVGQSALQVAHACGARIIASGGNAEKRALLATFPGVEAVIDSRNPALFRAGVMAATGGYGVDAVLNSLAGDGQAESLRCMAPMGRFVEIGKVDILENRRMSLGALKENVSFHSVHLDLLDKTHPHIVRALIEEVCAKLDDGTLKCINSKTFAAEDAVDAFKLMSSGKHHGKIVVSTPPGFGSQCVASNQTVATTAPAKTAAPFNPPVLPQTLFSGSATVLVTGGTRGVGLAVARWCAARGAAELLVCSGSGTIPEDAELELASLRASHPVANVRAMAVDVTDAAAVRAVFDSCNAEGRPVRSVFHAANVYTAADCTSLTESGLDVNWSVKVQGALNLKAAADAQAGVAMEHFVMFSSLAGLHGNHGQAVYVAANAAMQRLALKWRAGGFAATTVDLPIVVGAGRLKEFRNAAELEINTGRGFGVVSFSRLESSLAEVCALRGEAGGSLLPGHVTIDVACAAGVAASYRRLNLNPMLFDHLAPRLSMASADEEADDEEAGGGGGGGGAGADQTPAEVEAAVIDKVAFVLGAGASDIELDVPLPEMGVDSLAAVELVNWALTTYGVSVSQTEFLSGLTPNGLCKRIVNGRKAGGGGGGGGGGGAKKAAPKKAAPKAAAQKSSAPAAADAGEEDDFLNELKPTQAVPPPPQQQQFQQPAQPPTAPWQQMPAPQNQEQWQQQQSQMQQWQTQQWQMQQQMQFGNPAGGYSTAPTAAADPDAPLEPVLTSPAGAVNPNVGLWELEMQSMQLVNVAKEDEQLEANKDSELMLIMEDQAKELAAGGEVNTADVRGPGTFGEVTLRLNETLNPGSLQRAVAGITAAGTASRVLVVRGREGAEHFCTGMDLEAATFGDDTMSEGLEQFAAMQDGLGELKMPLIVVVAGACRGGGMLFPSMGTIVLAVEGATFGFPEIRRGGLPGVVSVAAQRRMNKAQCERFMCTGDPFDAETAQRAGLVDFIGTEEQVDRELKRLLGRFAKTETDLLSACKTRCPATSPERALLAMGSLDKRDRVREREAGALVTAHLDEESGVGVLTLSDAVHCNAIDWAMSDDLRRAIDALKRRKNDLRALVLQGAGDHFCVGVNPYNFIRRTKQLPVITSAQITYEIYRAFVGVRDLGCPVICAVHGKVVGGGLAAMLNADYRIADASTSFNYGNLPRGVCPGLLLSHNLAMTVGHRAATDLYMNDATTTAAEAQAIGLVNEVASSPAAAQRIAYEMAVRLASYPATGVQNTLRLMRPPIDEDRLARECVGIARCNKKGGAFTGKWKAGHAAAKMGPTALQRMAKIERNGKAGGGAAPAFPQQMPMFGGQMPFMPQMPPPMPPAAAPAAALLAAPVKAHVPPEPPCSQADSMAQLAAKGTPLDQSRWTTAEANAVVEKWAEGMGALPASVAAAKLAQPAAGAAKATTVFLTGATGFLGAFIVRDLLERGFRVLCLVRAGDEAKGFARVQSNMAAYGLWRDAYAADGGALTACCGDLDAPAFGLAPARWLEAAASCGVCLHNGACVDFANPIEDLAPTNVGGTRSAVQLALAGGMRFVHISSLSVFSLHHFAGSAEERTPDPRVLINGYARSKWVAEQLVWKAGKELELAVAVVRPGRIMGDSSTGAANLKDWFARYLISCVQLGCSWDLEHETDMTQVDDVAGLALRAATMPLSGAGKGSACLHAVSAQNVSTSEMVALLQGLGYDVRAVPYKWWMGAVEGMANKSEGAKVAMAPLIECFRALPVAEQAGQSIRFTSDMPHSNGSGNDCFHRMAAWMQEKGFLPKPAALAGKPRLVDSYDGPTVAPNVVHPAAAAAGTSDGEACGSGIGIEAMELYTPNHMVEQSDMEKHHGCEGKYTAGLLQDQIGFCGDDEDAVSMALTVTKRLMERNGIKWEDVGRVEVGTESLLDRSKSIKTHLMRLWGEHGCHDVEGVDNYNACYGGTAAFLNTMEWLRSPASEGRYGVVVCVDIADLNEQQAFLNGASAVAMLVSRDAAVQMMPHRASHMLHTWDFYKPVGWKDSFPLMRDGKHSIDCYMECLDGCYRGVVKRVYGEPEASKDKALQPAEYAKVAGGNLVQDTDYFVNHCTSTYLCKRAFKRTCENAFPPGGLKLRDQQTLYTEKVCPSTQITKKVGSSYTASCYTNLFSLFSVQSKTPEKLMEKVVAVFSYGSGSASSMYRLKVNRMPVLGTGPVGQAVSPTASSTSGVFEYLQNRVPHSPAEYLAMIDAYSVATYGRFDFKPKDWGGKQTGVFYLKSVDEWGIRTYAEEGNDSPPLEFLNFKASK